MEAKKIIRLADVGELEADLKKDLAEEEAKGKVADVLYCESISDELSDLGNLPTIDPKTLRPKARWEPVKPDSDIWFRCSHCGCEISTSWDYDDPDDMWNYCPSCGAKMVGD